MLVEFELVVGYSNSLISEILWYEIQFEFEISKVTGPRFKLTLEL